MINITRSQAVNLIQQSQGKIFRVTFRKRTTGEIRTLVGRVGVHRGLKGKGLPFNPQEKNLIVVRDVQKKDFRMINVEGLMELATQHQIYSITD